MNYYYTASVVDEHTFLCGYNRVRRYGTTTNVPDTRPKNYIHYSVQPNDTLQGIALKHNCSVSAIVRANRLWSAASLHLKQSIRIPVPIEDDTSITSPDSPSTSALNKSKNSTTNPQIKASNAPPPIPTTPIPERPQESMKDILSRIDANIRTTSTTVRQLERESTVDELDEPPRQTNAGHQRRAKSQRHNSLTKVYNKSYQMME